MSSYRRCEKTICHGRCFVAAHQEFRDRNGRTGFYVRCHDAPETLPVSGLRLA
jgi:hypothetical protein